MRSLSTILCLTVVVFAVAETANDATTATNIPNGIQKLFDEVQLPCAPRAVLNRPCYFCKCNVHGDRQHCIYTCSPTSGNPNMPGTKVCNAEDKIQQGCKRCRCSNGHLFYDCFLALRCNGGAETEEPNDF
ncbi:uncharacterized protein LOC131429967 [Malaya genurostris]|uniref:uncharacterized protein LOC131429967 n=1 Tax=Malaya genurostris TaxID=325434 RepID=UPI0026F391FA|nr:uncharacterized protein LOC131429967 [Malaya genurostris]